MDFKHLEYVLAVASEKSISKAAIKVYSTQPALSQYLNRTEKQIGAPLFHRTRKAMVLTEVGEKYVAAAQLILEIGQKTDLLIEEIKNLEKGRITLGISQERGSVVLPHVLPIFYRMYPGIRVEIVQSSTRNLEVEAVQGRVDIAVFPMVKPLKSYSELDYDVLCLEEILLVVPKSHPFVHQLPKQGTLVDLSRFKNDVFCLKNKASNIRIATDSIFRDNGIKPRVLLEATNTFTVHNTAVNTGSLAFIPKTLTRFSELDRSCLYFQVSPDKYRTPIIAANRKGSYLNKATRDLVQIMRDYLGSIIQDTDT